MPVEPVTRSFGSVGVAMVTPFTATGELDLDTAQKLAAYLVDGGADALVVSGTTGESPTTSDVEKDQLLRAVIEAAGGRAVIIAGIGTNDTAHTVELSRQAARAGAHGLLAVTPYYSKPSQAGLVAHFTAVADATDLPVMLYDIPGRSAIPIQSETLLELAMHPNIVAVKDAKDDLFAGAWLLEQTGLEIYSGTDQLNLPWLSIGASGMISVVGHVAAGQYRRMVEAVDAGDLVTARRINSEVLPAVRGIMTRAQGAVMAKAALELMGVLPTRTVRLPQMAATNEEVALLRSDLEEAKLL
ncbi:4-hydroxy-tetrahydrodipicolinate synthase [Kineosporia sp. J2-2]|uniref:4-hydroxy-tetrahydrodipicolinate synthase n=1 Tax=Kineosporia corallincola TaxID=2835133 RepID=A0ABS5TSY5_9ACTN|nr:4-hydroxy-tetrahydrodipicolinate synthase [Kineosporia corallincola]MBT0773897.1 4-hydroxy-tetrahydrodipicolinate synthase [Kineosporia corallincola]